MAEYVYDVAVARKPFTAQVTDAGVAVGEKRPVRFDEVESIRWHQTYVNRMISRSLDLRSASGSVTLNQIMPAGSGPSDPRVASYIAVAQATLRGVAAVRPDLKVELGPPAFLRWFMFACFLVGVLVALFVISAVLGSRNAGSFWWVALIVGLGGLFSAFQAWRGRPWRAREFVSPEQLAGDLAR